METKNETSMVTIGEIKKEISSEREKIKKILRSKDFDDNTKRLLVKDCLFMIDVKQGHIEHRKWMEKHDKLMEKHHKFLASQDKKGLELRWVKKLATSEN